MDAWLVFSDSKTASTSMWESCYRSKLVPAFHGHVFGFYLVVDWKDGPTASYIRTHTEYKDLTSGYTYPSGLLNGQVCYSVSQAFTILQMFRRVNMVGAFRDVSSRRISQTLHDVNVTFMNDTIKHLGLPLQPIQTGVVPTGDYTSYPVIAGRFAIQFWQKHGRLPTKEELYDACHDCHSKLTYDRYISQLWEWFGIHIPKYRYRDMTFAGELYEGKLRYLICPFEEVCARIPDFLGIKRVTHKRNSLHHQHLISDSVADTKKYFIQQKAR